MNSLTPEETAELAAIEQKISVTEQEATRRTELRIKLAEIEKLKANDALKAEVAALLARVSELEAKIQP